jgi:hypothetical protein
LKTVEVTASRLPDTKFGIVLPTRRPCYPWYQDRVEDLSDNLTKGIKEIGARCRLAKVASIKCSPASSQDFESDGVHLTNASGKIFVDEIISGAESFFNAPLIDVEDTPDSSGRDQNDELIKSLERRLTRLEMDFKKQVKINFANNLIIARTREEMDAASNRSKEDRVVLTGLKSKSKSPPPTEPRAKIEWLKKLAMEIFKEIVPGFPGKIFYLSQGKNADKFLPMIEVKLDSAENAAAIRKAFALKRKNKSLPVEMETLFVTNCVNLATRVRIDILKAIARRITNSNEVAYVSGFISRPMMHIKKAGTTVNTRPLKSFTFIDAISRFHNLMAKGDLATAYERAGVAFSGQLGQNFVVLNDEDQPKTGPTRTGGTSGGRSGPPGPSGPSGRSGTSGPTGSASKSDSSRGTKRSGQDLENGKSKK